MSCHSLMKCKTRVLPKQIIYNVIYKRSVLFNRTSLDKKVELVLY